MFFINCYFFMWVKAILRSEGERYGFWSTPWPMWSGLFGVRGLRYKEVEYGLVVFCWMPKALAYYVKEGCSFSSNSLNLGREGENMASKFCKFFRSLMRLLNQCWGGKLIFNVLLTMYRIYGSLLSGDPNLTNTAYWHISCHS